VKRKPAILLSASVPNPTSTFAITPAERTNLDEAVMSLARALFSSGGRLVFGGHPTISPLIATIAGEYAPPSEDVANDEDPLGNVLAGIYQSELFKGHVAFETLLLFRLGFARIVWTDRGEGEYLNDLPGTASEKYPGSLAEMRRRMIADSDPDAMVCAGGMAGVDEEIEKFRDLRPNAPIYLLEGTGGATARAATKRSPNTHVIDRDLLQRLRTTSRNPDDEIRPAVLYPIVAQTIVSELRSHQ
jgi:SLOG cluster3 family